jgi:hypothetical protein
VTFANVALSREQIHKVAAAIEAMPPEKREAFIAECEREMNEAIKRVARDESRRMAELEELWFARARAVG